MAPTTQTQHTSLRHTAATATERIAQIGFPHSGFPLATGRTNTNTAGTRAARQPALMCQPPKLLTRPAHRNPAYYLSLLSLSHVLLNGLLLAGIRLNKGVAHNLIEAVE